ncbi:hypothetical protein JW752_03685 [Candidatus Peregrinibacteria bacterium]|nr:hypothetical protein [Candidatus Peregrinibacteria bacterium]
MSIDQRKSQEEKSADLMVCRQKSAAECRRLLVFLFGYSPDEETGTREQLLDELLNLAIIHGVKKQ